MDTSRPEQPENAAHSPQPRGRGASHAEPSKLKQFAEKYGWWRVVAIPVMSIITVWMLVDVVSGDETTTGLAAEDSAAQQTDNQEQPAGENGEEAGEVGPDPASAEALRLAAEQLPPGGAYSESGDKTFRVVGQPGMQAGEGTEKTIRYTVEVENGVDTRAYGGDSAFAAMVDATLGDPRGWTNDPRFKFVHVGPDEEADTRIRLTSLATTAELCGDMLAMETSCHTRVTGESTVIVNESRWVRGAQPYEGDLGNYRQYLINHEVGHAIGYGPHQPCGGNGQLAPIMMQQTISLNNRVLSELADGTEYNSDDVTCEPNPWPYPKPTVKDVHAPGEA